SNVIYPNRSYQIGVGTRGIGAVNQQNVVTLYNAVFGGTGHGTAVANQTATGACVTTGTSYWDIGVRGDTGPTNHGSGVTLTASDTVFSPGGASVVGGGNSTANPNFVSFYCDGSRTPPEAKASGWQVPPGISDASVPNPLFNLTPAATVDEGNNWVNI